MPQPLNLPIENALMHRLEFIYKGAKTKRFHTADTLTSQTVGEHSFGVAWLIMIIQPQARRELLLAALSHDLAEHVIGDVSSPTKRAHPILKAWLDVAEANVLQSNGLDYTSLLSVKELEILKVADNFDGMLWAIREYNMGAHKSATEVYNNFYNYYVGEGVGTGDVGYDLFLIIENLWRRANAS